MGKKPNQEFHAYGGDGGESYADANAQASNRVHIDTSSRNTHTQGVATVMTALIGGILLVLGVAIAAIATALSVTLISVAVAVVGIIFLGHSVLRIAADIVPHVLTYKTQEHEFRDRENAREHEMRMLIAIHHLNAPPQISVSEVREPKFLTDNGVETIAWYEVKHEEEKARVHRT